VFDHVRSCSRPPALPSRPRPRTSVPSPLARSDDPATVTSEQERGPRRRRLPVNATFWPVG
jgi:hypothetical protein